MFDNAKDLVFESREADVVLNDGALVWRKPQINGPAIPMSYQELKIIPIKSMLARLYYKEKYDPRVKALPNCMVYAESITNVCAPADPQKTSCNSCADYMSCSPTRLLLAYVKNPEAEKWTTHDFENVRWVKIPRTGMGPYVEFCQDYAQHNRVPGIVSLHLAIPAKSKSNRRSMAFKYEAALPQQYIDKYLSKDIVDHHFSELAKKLNQQYAAIKAAYNTSPDNDVKIDIDAIDMSKKPDTIRDVPIAAQMQIDDIMPAAPVAQPHTPPKNNPQVIQNDPLAELFNI